MLRVRFVKGMASVVGRPVPDISVYGDGRVLTTAIDLTSYPVRQGVNDQRLSGVAYRRVYRDARLAGLAQSRIFHSDKQILDAGPTVVTLLADGGWHTSKVEPGAGGARVWLIDRLISHLRSLPRGDLVGPPGTYRPTRMAIVAWRSTAGTSGGLPEAGPVAPWPLRPLTGGEQATCTLLAVADAEAAARLAGSAQPNTRWRSGADLYAVLFRPLLPDEADCTAVTP